MSDTVTVKYTGGLDSVTVYGRTSGENYLCDRGEKVTMLAADAAGLSPAEWEGLPKAKVTEPTEEEAADVDGT